MTELEAQIFGTIVGIGAAILIEAILDMIQRNNRPMPPSEG